MIREFSSPISPASRKRNILDVVQKSKKRKPTPADDNIDDIVVEYEHESDGTYTKMGGSFHVTPRNDTPVKSTIEETSIPDVNANVSNTDVNMNYGAQQSTIIPE